MRGRAWVPVIVGLALVVLVAGVVVAVMRSDLFGGRDPSPVPAGPTYADGALTPQEQTVDARPRPDGSIEVSVEVVFDAGPGTDRPVTWTTGATRLGWVSDERRAQYWARPRVEELTARVVDPGRQAEALAVSTLRPERDDPFLDPTTHRFTPAAPWAAGRHRVRIDYRLRDVHVTADGDAMLVLPLGYPSGPLDDQPRDVTRIAVAGAPALECPATNVTFAERRPCAGNRGGQVYGTRRGPDQVEALVFAPTGVRAAAAPMPVREVR